MGSGWAGLIKNICRSTLLSAFASLIDRGVLGPGAPPSLGPQGRVCKGCWDSPYDRALFLKFPGIYPMEGTSRKLLWQKRARTGAELIPAFSLRLFFGASRSLPLSHQLQPGKLPKMLREFGNLRDLEDDGVPMLGQGPAQLPPEQSCVWVFPALAVIPALGAGLGAV